MTTASNVFGRRLREARDRAGLTQEALAHAAGIDEFSASARMSQYETGKHWPHHDIARNLAKALRVPVEYLYASDDKTAELLLLWGRLPVARRTQLLADIREQVGD